jgi:hypothetical protein
MPRVRRALADALAGRTGLLLLIVFKMVKGDSDTAEGIQQSLGRGLPDLIGYLNQQMAAGTLRADASDPGPPAARRSHRRPPDHPPLVALVGFNRPQYEVVDQIVEAWLRTMAPDRERRWCPRRGNVQHA